jgi:hypothetical protein
VIGVAATGQPRTGPATGRAEGARGAEPGTDGAAPAQRPAEYRYGAVFLLVLALLVFVIVAPTAGWSRAVGLALEGTALVVGGAPPAAGARWPWWPRPSWGSPGWPPGSRRHL